MRGEIGVKHLGCWQAMVAVKSRKTAAREASENTQINGSTPIVTSSLSRTISGTGSLAGAQKPYLAKMEPPSISGNMRDYPILRED